MVPPFPFRQVAVAPQEQDEARMILLRKVWEFTEKIKEKSKKMKGKKGNDNEGGECDDSSSSDEDDND